MLTNTNIKTFVTKLPIMRKEQRFVVYPREKDSKKIFIQSKNRIACIDEEKETVLVSTSRSSGSYFVHLTPQAGAKLFPAPKELLEQIKAAEAQQ